MVHFETEKVSFDLLNLFVCWLGIIALFLNDLV